MNGRAQRSANGRNSPLWWAPHWAEKYRGDGKLYQGTQWKLVIFVTKVTKLWPNIWNCMKPYILKGWFWAAHVSSIPQKYPQTTYFQNTEATQDLLYIVSTPGSATPLHAVQTTLPEQTHAARDIWCPCWWSRSFRMEIVKSILHTRVMFPKWARTQEEKSCPQTRQTCSKTVKKQMLNSILTLLNFETEISFFSGKNCTASNWSACFKNATAPGMFKEMVLHCRTCDELLSLKPSCYIDIGGMNCICEPKCQRITLQTVQIKRMKWRTKYFGMPMKHPGITSVQTTFTSKSNTRN